MERRCWVNFQCWGVLLIWIVVGQRPTVLAVGAGGGCLDIFSLIHDFSFLSPSLWETTRYRLKYCLKGPLSPKQPTNIILNRDEHEKSFITSEPGMDTIKSHIPPSKPKGKEAHSQIHNHSQKKCTVNRMNSSFPKRWSFS